MCGGVSFFVMRFVNEAQEQLGDIDWEEVLSVDDEMLADMVRDVEEVQSAVGDVQSVETDYEKTDEESNDFDSFVWHRVKGSSGEAWLVTEYSEDEDREYNLEAELVLDDGTRTQIILTDLPYHDYAEREIYFTLNEDQRVTGAIGEINKIEVDWDRTDEETDPDVMEFWYTVSGPSGNISVLTDEEADVIIKQVELPDNTTFKP